MKGYELSPEALADLQDIPLNTKSLSISCV